MNEMITPPRSPAASTPPAPVPPSPGYPVPASPWLAALAIVPVLATVYQTLVLTDVTDDVIRKGIQGDPYDKVWVSLTWGAAILYGVFLGVWGMARYGQRATVSVGLALFAAGNLLCGAAQDVPGMAAARVVEGLGKGLTMALGRAMLYRQFDRAVLAAIGFYALFAYATRPVTPLLAALVNDTLSWRWIFWVNVPIALFGLVLVQRFVRPDRPARPVRLRLDWLAVTLLVAWVVCLLFTFSWYRKWGGWSSNAFALTATLSLIVPIVLVVRVAGGFSPDEHLRRIFRVRTYVLAMCVRMLLLVHLGAVLGLMAKYLVELRDYPRVTAGGALVPASLGMALSSFLTIRFHRRSLRHVWLLAGVLGSAGCLWRLSAVDVFTAKEDIALMLGCWGLFVGLLPPAFLTDEVEALDRRDSLYGAALAVVFLVVPLLTIPTMMSTVVSEWSDRALDAQRTNLREERPAVGEATARVADYYRQRGVSGPELSQLSGAVLGASAKLESVAHGIRSGLRFLSLVTGGIGVVVTVLLFLSPAGRPPAGATP